jgi:hypothetical protein
LGGGGGVGENYLFLIERITLNSNM